MEGSNEIDWTPASHITEPHTFISALTRFLEGECASALSFQESTVREAIFFTSCKFICSSMMTTITSASVRRINMLGVYNLGVDLRYLERFAERVDIPSLFECFSELRQLVSLVMSGQPEQIMDPALRAASFPHVPIPILLTMLEKYKEGGGGGAATKDLGLPKMRKRDLESLIGCLRE